MNSRHLVRDGSGEKENSDPSLETTVFKIKAIIMIIVIIIMIMIIIIIIIIIYKIR